MRKLILAEEPQGSKLKQVKSKIIDFLRENPNPKDKAIHGLSEELGIDPHMFEEIIYSLLSGFLRENDIVPGGLADGLPDEKFDPQQLEMGIKVELEHTDDPDLAKEITKDHLMEFPDYYTRLLDMEEDAEE